MCLVSNWIPTQLKSRVTIGEKTNGEWTMKVENRTREKFLAVGEACKAIF